MQTQVWSWAETNWSLILMLIVGSGALAWFGDIIGMKFGKRRISIFGMRPKVTSHFITALTGMTITVIVVVVLSSISDSVHTALFSLKYIQRQLDESRVNLSKSHEDTERALQELSETRQQLSEQEDALAKNKSELDIMELSVSSLKNDKQLLENEKSELDASIQVLKDEADELRERLEQMREENITVRVREVLAQDVIKAGTSSEDIIAVIEKMKLEAGMNVAERFGLLPENVTVEVDKGSIEASINSSINSQSRRYIRMSASQNITASDEISVECQTGDSYLIYDNGETIYRRLADNYEENFSAEEYMHIFLRELRFKAIRDGVMPDPVTSNVGSLDGQDFYATVEMLSEIKEGPVIVNAIAVGDIYSEGPIHLKIFIEE